MVILLHEVDVLMSENVLNKYLAVVHTAKLTTTIDISIYNFYLRVVFEGSVF
jgi:predicted glycosyltransferase involved in capsule biosynthesis